MQTGTLTISWWWQKLGKDLLWVNKQGTDFIRDVQFQEVDDKEQYRVDVSNTFAASKHLDAEVEINSASETIIENIKISAGESLGYYELNKCKSSGLENR
jgi:hypothetical protein